MSNPFHQAIVDSTKTMGEKRIALVVGNESYADFRNLATPVNDATCVRNMLERFSFKVDCRTNQTRRDIWDTIQDVVEELKGGATSLVVYYAGHGCSVDGIEYLIPIDGRNMEKISKAAKDFIKIEEVIEEFATNRVKVEVPIIFILDCCRVELGQGGGRTVVDMRNPGGIYALGNPGGVANVCIMYSTASGQTALDSDSKSDNGAYAEYLLKHLDQTITISELSTAVRRDLFNDSRFRNMQVAFTTETLFYPFYLSPIGPDGDEIAIWKNKYSDCANRFSQQQRETHGLLSELRVLRPTAKEGQEVIKTLEKILQKADAKIPRILSEVS